MNTYVALFRGINVGGKSILPMKDLVALLERMGFEGVKTYIQSGNAVFRSAPIETDKTAREIRAAIQETHGFAPAVLLLEAAELQAAAANNPFQAADGKALHFFFLESLPGKPDLAGLAAVKAETERFELGGKAFYLYAPDGIGRSRLAAKVEQSLGVPVTARNWNTVSKLLSMVAG
jgi:uncharacterized protein (DUF1697 family)